MTDSTSAIPYANSYWVVPGLLLAGEHPEIGDVGTTEDRLAALLTAGIRVFIDLTEEHETNGYALVLRCLAEERGMEATYLRIPFPDGGVPRDRTMRCILNVIDDALGDRQAVFVHCFGGIGRTGTVVGCHLRRHKRATTGDVMAIIARLRQGMPVAVHVSPHEPEQVRMVENWEEGS
jgi:protein-tyrosine phosphatase